MLDPKTIRQDPEAVRVALARRGFLFDVDQFLALEARRKSLQLDSERLQNERNTKSKSIGQAKAAGATMSKSCLAKSPISGTTGCSQSCVRNRATRSIRLLLSIPNIPDASRPERRG